MLVIKNASLPHSLIQIQTASEYNMTNTTRRASHLNTTKSKTKIIYFITKIQNSNKNTK